jgi:hypothetical protein
VIEAFVIYYAFGAIVLMYVLTLCACLWPDRFSLEHDKIATALALWPLVWVLGVKNLTEDLIAYIRRRLRA